MRRWMRVLLVGVLALMLSIDSASACRFFRSRCRPRCRPAICHRVPRHRLEAFRRVEVVACDPCCVAEVIVSPQCCVPADGSAHAVLGEAAPEPTAKPAIAAETGSKPTSPIPSQEPLPKLQPPVAPASAEQPATTPQFKTAADILAESEAREKAEAEEAARKAAENAAARRAEELLQIGRAHV